MEIYLGTDDDKIRFPIVPSSIGVNRSNNIDTQSVLKLGEVPIFNGTSLKTIEFESFFPNQEYSFCDYTGFMKPYEYLKSVVDSGELGKITHARVRNVHTGKSANWLPEHFYDKTACGGGATILASGRSV